MPDIPDWDGMPAPSSLITLSWEDIYGVYLEKGITPTKEQVTKVFEKMERKAADNMMEDFWASIDYYLE